MRVAVVGAVLGASIVCSSVAAAGPLDKPAFTATPKDLLDAAKATGSATVELRSEETLVYDDAGRVTHRSHSIVYIADRSAAAGWGELSRAWHPSHQARPVFRARVIAPDGSVKEVDASTLTDAPADDSAEAASDRRVAEVNLPTLALGSVVEQQVEEVESSRMFAAGTLEVAALWHSYTCERDIVTIEAPTSLALHVAVRGASIQPTKTTKAGRTTWVVDRGRSQPPSDGDLAGAVPSDVFVFPYVAVSTGASWATVATAYAKLVDDQIAKGSVTLPGGVAGSSARATVDATLAWMQKRVRHAGTEVETDDPTPAPPADVLKRGYGNSKDEAALLVALLRSAGITANVALLDAHAWLEADRELPGMRQFDHAIVRARVDGQDVWIDPSNNRLPAGTLPLRDRGHMVMLATPDTRDLAAIPVADSSSGSVAEVRRFDLGERDYARITETHRESGSFTGDIGDWLTSAKPEAVRAYYADSAERRYGGTIDDYKSGSSSEVTLHVSHPRYAVTEPDRIDVLLWEANVTAGLPDILTRTDEATANEVATRTVDYLWWQPHTYTIENRMVLPDGYQAPDIVAEEHSALGTMTLATTRAVDGNTLVVTYKLDTGKPRITAKELAETRAAVIALRKKRSAYIKIPLTAAALARTHEAKKAVAEMQRLIAKQPKDAMHHLQLGAVYSMLGMTAAARREAKRATELEPKWWRTWHFYANALEVDTVGRQWGYDADRPGAIAAHRKAVELDPKRQLAHVRLADALVAASITSQPVERDYLDAASEYRAADAIDGSHKHDLDVAQALLAGGKLDEAEKLARGVASSKRQRSILLAAVAGQRGADAAVGELGSGAATDKDEAVAAAMDELLRLRHYDDARKLYGSLSRPLPVAARTLIERLDKVEIAKQDATDARSPVVGLFAASIDMKVPHTWSSAIDASLDDLRQQIALRIGTNNSAAALDVMAAELKTADGNADDGYRVVYSLDGTTEFTFLVAPDAKKQLVLVGGTMFPRATAEYLRSIASDPRRAGRMLDFLGADRAWSKALGPAIAKQRGGNPPTKELVEVVAAILSSHEPGKNAAWVLERLTACEQMDADLAYLCRIAASEAHLQRREYAEAAEVAGKILATRPDDLPALHQRVDALVRAKRGSEAIPAVEAALAKTPDSRELLVERLFIAHGESWSAEVPWIEKLLARPKADVQDYNLAAWDHLLHDATIDRARELGKQMEAKWKTIPENAENTLAAIAAEDDDPVTARVHLERSSSRWVALRDADLYVLGRMAEACGLRDDAIAAYKRVKKPVDPFPNSAEAYDFAVRGLKRLGVSP